MSVLVFEGFHKHVSVLVKVQLSFLNYYGWLFHLSREMSKSVRSFFEELNYALHFVDLFSERLYVLIEVV